MYVCMYTMCVSKGIGCDSCEPFDVGVGTQFQSSAKAMIALATEPAP